MAIQKPNPPHRWQKGESGNPLGRPGMPWRSELRRQFGADILRKVIDIALGNEIVYPNGRREVPPVNVQHAAAQTALAYLVGKPVPETEVAKAEEAQAKLRELDEKDLKRMVAETLETDAEIVPAAGNLPATVETKKPSK